MTISEARAAGLLPAGDAKPNRRVTASERTKLEDAFLAAWRVVAADLPEPVPQYRFHPVRKWRFDFSFKAVKLAVEIDGGSFVKGGGAHNRGAGRERDNAKANAAVAAGWVIMRYGTKAMSDPIAVALEVAAVLRARTKGITP